MTHPDQWMPHGFCFLWDPAILWTLTTSNVAVAVAYGVIAATLYIAQRGRADLFAGRAVISYLFAAFILACGIGHAVKVVTYWHPVYHAEAAIDTLTALLSVGTAGVLVRFWRALSTMPSREEVDRARDRARSAEANLRAVEALVTEDARQARRDAEERLARIEAANDGG